MAASPTVRRFTVSSTDSTSGPQSSSDSLTGYASLQLVGTLSLTVQCQVSLDGGTTWTAVLCTNMQDAATSISCATEGIWYRADVGGAPLYRWKCSAYTSGTPVAHYTERMG